MKNILVVGSLGQLGSEIAIGLRKKYGNDNVVLTDIRDDVNRPLVEGGPFYKMDSRDGESLLTVHSKAQDRYNLSLSGHTFGHR